MTSTSESSPSDVVERSVALTKAGRYEENDQLLQAGLARFPEDPELRLHASAAAVGRDEPEAARALVFEAVELAPEDPYILTRAASAVWRFEDYDHAEEWVRRAGRLASDDFALWGSILHVSGKLLLLRGDEEHAEEPLRLAFEADPRMGGHAQVLASLLDRRDRADEALEVLTEGLRARPQDKDLEQAREELVLRLDAMTVLGEVADLLRCCGQDTEAAWNLAGQGSLADLHLKPSDECDLTIEEVKARQRELTERLGGMNLTFERNYPNSRPQRGP